MIQFLHEKAVQKLLWAKHWLKLEQKSYCCDPRALIIASFKVVAYMGRRRD